MKYFILRDLGIDGVAVRKFDSKQQAEAFYLSEIKEEKQFSSIYHINDDVKMALIEGEVIKNSGFEFETL